MLYKAGSKLILTGKKLRYKAVWAQISVTVTDVMLFCARMKEVHPLSLHLQEMTGFPFFLMLCVGWQDILLLV